MKYKRFLVFQYSHYYPSGGFNDLTRNFDTKEEVEKYLAESYECKQIWQRCGKCKELQKMGKYEDLHQWEDVNIVEDLIGNEYFDVDILINNYDKKLENEEDN